MTTGQTWPAEWRQYSDPVSGARITQLTGYKCHSHHLYFTNRGWYAGGSKLLIGSDRGNRTNLYGVDLLDGGLTQLTDLPELIRKPTLLDTSKNPVREEAYFWANRVLLAVNLETCAVRELYRAPDGFTTSMTNATADGRYVMSALVEDLSHRFRVNMDHGYIGFQEYWEAHPLSRVIRVAPTSSAPRKMPGKPSTLFTWFAKSLRPVATMRAPAAFASSGSISGSGFANANT